MKRFLALKVVGFSALASSILLPSVAGASAASVDGCGVEPAGGTLENISGVCELTFDSAGEYTWTLPAGIADLHGVLVGAGGGAGSFQPDAGYGGAGGDVAYVDLTNYVADDVVGIGVASGGLSAVNANGGNGGSSEIVINGNRGPQQADGGAGASMWNFSWGYCNGGQFAENIGADASAVAPEGGACIGGGPGLIPGSDPDAPAIFDGVTTELGHGGGVYYNTIHNPGIGEGANVRYQTLENAVIADIAGADGAVIFRYTPVESLASTGGALPTAFAALASVAIIAAGIGFRPFNRRRSRASN